ncbi:MAG: hypothetical protein CM1200mP35_05300 [Chloroflexota bacterium]|nr:MAG: hypothetical protein CM1200mP35_05300 [Chloroflexota bacterium]
MVISWPSLVFAFNTTPSPNTEFLTSPPVDKLQGVLGFWGVFPNRLTLGNFWGWELAR